jgi:hypothetical protein
MSFDPIDDPGPDIDWSDFDEVDTEDFGFGPIVPKCIDQFLPVDDPDLSWEDVLGGFMAEEISREIDEAVARHARETVDLPIQSPHVDTVVERMMVDRYPHRCPRCGGRAYVGMADVDCEARCGA